MGNTAINLDGEERAAAGHVSPDVHTAFESKGKVASNIEGGTNSGAKAFVALRHTKLMHASMAPHASWSVPDPRCYVLLLAQQPRLSYAHAGNGGAGLNIAYAASWQVAPKMHFYEHAKNHRSTVGGPISRTCSIHM